MANSSSKPLATQKPFSIFLMTLIFFLSLITGVKSDSFFFNFPRFEPGVESILVDGDANTTGGVLQLTKKDSFGKPSTHNVGLSALFGVIHLSDKRTGKIAEFRTEFPFVVNPKGSPLHGDGFTFYLASLDFEFPEHNSDGGFLGLFINKTALSSSKNHIVAVEFHSFTNEWGALVGGDGDVADPVGLAVPGVTREGVEEEGLGDGDTCGGVEEGGDGVVGGVVEHDLAEEGGLAVAAGAAIEGVLVVVEGVVGGLYEVVAAEYQCSEVHVQRLQQPFPVVAASRLPVVAAESKAEERSAALNLESKEIAWRFCGLPCGEYTP